MKKSTLTIKPLEGLGELKFGASKAEVIEYLGKPDEEEIIEDEEIGNSLIMHFFDSAVSVFFENPDDPVLNNFETDNPDAMLFGKHIFTLNEDEVKKLMNKNGFNDLDEELMESDDFDTEKRVSFDDAMVDFFFEDNVLTAVNWGVFFDDETEEEE